MSLFPLLFFVLSFRESWAFQRGTLAFQEFVTNHCVQDGINYSGTELVILDNVEMEACQFACQFNLQCDHASFATDIKRCYLRANNTGRVEDSNYLSIPKECIPNCSLDATDFWGNDVGNAPDVQTLEECQIRCRQKTDCLGAVWTKPWALGLSPNACWFKGSFVVGDEMYLGRGVAVPRFCPDAMLQPNGWYQYQNKYYKFIAENNSFEGANGFCEGMGAQMATVDSHDEYMFIRSMAFALTQHHSDEFAGSFRLGLYKNESLWTWSNGTSLNFSSGTFWCFGQPDNMETEVQTKFLDSGGFCVVDDIPSVEANFICMATVCDLPVVKNAQFGTKIPGDLRER